MPTLRLGPECTPGKAALLLATLLLGVFLALFGQTYQTGADPWQLFANWALLILPWEVAPVGEGLSGLPRAVVVSELDALRDGRVP